MSPGLLRLSVRRNSLVVLDKRAERAPTPLS
jgi:hypothetical protein